MDDIVQLIEAVPQEALQELWDLEDVVQDATHHPEGSAFTHTLYVMEAAKEISLREELDAHKRLILFLAAMTHDLGKVSTTEVHEDGRITAYGHPDASVPLADALLTRIGHDRETIDEVLPLVREHMAWVGFFTPEITTRAIKRLARRLAPATFEMWALLVEADMSGRPPLVKGLPEKAHQMLLMARELGVNNGYVD